MSKNRSGPGPGGSSSIRQLPISVASATTYSASGPGVYTLPVSTVATGNFLVFAFYAGGTPAASPSSVSGGNVTTWQLMGWYENVQGAIRVELWGGVVTGTGPGTITVMPGVGTTAGLLMAQEFEAPGATTWAFYGDASNGNSTTTSSSYVLGYSFPSLTPKSPANNEMFITTLGIGTGTVNSVTVTPGWTYTTCGGAYANDMVLGWWPNYSVGPTSPPPLLWGDASYTAFAAVSCFVYATGP